MNTNATLVQIGAPTVSAPDDFTDRDLGIVGLFNYQDNDNQDDLDDNESMMTAFFRDVSESAVNEVFGRSNGNINGQTNHHRPWRLMTSAAKVDALDSSTTMDSTDVNTDFFPTAVEFGGIKLTGYDPDYSEASNYSTGYANRIVTDIQAAHDAETNGQSSNPWHGGGTPLLNALASAKAVKDYVDTEISTVNAGNFNSTAVDTDDFDFGIGSNQQVANATFAYTEGNASRIVTMDGNAVETYRPEHLGLALSADSAQTSEGKSRGDIGWLPGDFSPEEPQPSTS